MSPTARYAFVWSVIAAGLLPVQTLRADDTVLASSSPVAPVAAAGVASISSLDLSRRDNTSVATLDLTAAPDDLWQRMRQGFAMQDLDMNLVGERQAWYTARPTALKAVLERGSKYLYYIVGELEKRGMPTELALLPLVESAFNPLAYSPAKASGLWQFIPSTGKDFNLAQNWWVDERRDVIASTDAALNYLQALYEMHGDWHLALASYNWGENAVMRAVNKNRAKGLPTDFANLTMPVETRNYVPKLQALKNIIANPQMFGIKLPELPNEAYFGTVEVATSIDLATAASLAEMPVKEFLELNPAFNRPVIPGRDDRTLVLPTEKIEIFQSNLEKGDRPLLSWRTYAVTRNERVEDIAARFGIPAMRLRQVNGLPPRGRLAAGYTLLVPSSQGAGEFASLSLPAAAPAETAKTQNQTATPMVKTRATSAGAATPHKPVQASTHKAAKPAKPLVKTRTRH
ncbi:transglycosylase SLT domain-containing protein [Niveibacterium sp. SC-1]|uniref:transglycosylase SLT domain-containing protein n=1 Tax=Niveibacterium sp. SC-1 TaxID=3135646 RepID=UPI00311DD1C9